MSVERFLPSPHTTGTFALWAVNVAVLVPLFGLTAWCWPSLEATYAVMIDPRAALESARASVASAVVDPLGFGRWVATVALTWGKAVVALGGAAMLALGVEWTVRGLISFLPKR